MNVKILNEKSIPNLPWQDRPADCQDVIWRYKANPIIKRNILPTSNSVFNSAVVPFEGGFAGVFRVDDKERNMQLHAGFSKDGINWDIQPERIQFETDIPEMAEFQYGYDPGYASSRIATTSPGATHTAGIQPLVWATPLTSRPSTSWRMHTCPSTGTACCSPGGSAATT